MKEFNENARIFKNEENLNLHVQKVQVYREVVNINKVIPRHTVIKL